MKNGSWDLVRPTLGLLRLLRISMRYFVQIFQNLEYNTRQNLQAPALIYTICIQIYLADIYMHACMPTYPIQLHSFTSHFQINLHSKWLCLSWGFFFNYYFYFIKCSYHTLLRIDVNIIFCHVYIYIYIYYFIIMGVI